MLMSNNNVLQFNVFRLAPVVCPSPFTLLCCLDRTRKGERQGKEKDMDESFQSLPEDLDSKGGAYGDNTTLITVSNNKHSKYINVVV